jgi:hypothetical protein
MIARAGIVAAALLAAGAIAPVAASAHGISGLASLPVPSWLFAWAAAIVLVASFVALSTLWSTPRLQDRRELRVCAWPAWIAGACGAIGVFLFGVVVWAGYEGVPYYTSNFDPTFIYVIFWVGVPVASVLVGDLFSAFSPWRALARTLRWGGHRLGVRRAPPLAYPDWLGRWPVVAGLLCFGWLELIYHDHDNPGLLASLSLAYFALMIVAMAMFGVERWSERGDAFGGYFNLVSRLSAFEVHDGALWLRRPLSGVTSLPMLPGSVAMILVIIGITTFDGASNGVVWNNLSPHIQSVFSGLGLGETPADELSDTVGLLIALAVVFTVYRLGVLGVRSVAGRVPIRQISGRFAHTLAPIAFAYVLAHYFSLLAWQGQAIGYLASNPLGHSANLFGTAHWHINYNFINSTAIWYVQVGALVVGHVSGLVLAHDRALASFRSATQAVRSQYWMLVVMVSFTCLGLWLLSDVNT